MLTSLHGIMRCLRWRTLSFLAVAFTLRPECSSSLSACWMGLRWAPLCCDVLDPSINESAMVASDGESPMGGWLRKTCKKWDKERTLQGGNCCSCMSEAMRQIKFSTDSADCFSLLSARRALPLNVSFNTLDMCMVMTLQRVAEQAKAAGDLVAGQHVLDVGVVAFSGLCKGSGCADWPSWRHIRQTPGHFWPKLRPPPDASRKSALRGLVRQSGFWNINAHSTFQAIAASFEGLLGTLQEEIRSMKPPPPCSTRAGWMQKYVWTARDGWRESACSELPSLCKALSDKVPTLRRSSILLMPMQEVIEVFGMHAGAQLQLHDDGGNDRVSMHYCVLGCEKAWVKVAGENRSYGGNGGWLLFDPSWKHTAGNPGKEERWVININIAHPDYDESFETVGKIPQQFLYSNTRQDSTNEKCSCEFWHPSTQCSCVWYLCSRNGPCLAEAEGGPLTNCYCDWRAIDDAAGIPVRDGLGSSK